MTLPDPSTRVGRRKNTRHSADRDLILSHDEAEAAVPLGAAACGEEDPGAALESLVTREDKPEPPRRQINDDSGGGGEL